MIFGRKGAALGVLTAAIAAALAYAGTPLANAALAAGFALFLTIAVLWHRRAVRQTHALLLKQQRQQTRIVKELADVRSRLREIGRHHRTVIERVDKRHAALDKKIAIAVDKLDERFTAEVRGLASAIRDSEIETGLAALNRYSLLATRSADAGDRTS